MTTMEEFQNDILTALSITQQHPSDEEKFARLLWRIQGSRRLGTVFRLYREADFEV